MKKWLVIAALGVAIALALLWMQMREPVAAQTVQPQTAAAEPAPLARNVELESAAKKIAQAQAQAGKLDPASDAFTYHYDEVLPGEITRRVAKCYEGGLHRVHRNQKAKLDFTVTIKNGVVSVTDVTIAEATIDDKAMLACFVREAATTTWRDDEMPDWQVKHETQLIRPERGMKKWTKENLEYEGSGPIGTLEAPDTNAPASRELPKQ